MELHDVSPYAIPTEHHHPRRPGRYPDVSDGRGDEPYRLVRGDDTIPITATYTVAVDPQFPIPAAPLILPATPGWGSWGTED